MLPLVAFYDGHPFRIRYMTPLVMASAEHVVGEVTAAVEQHGIRFFRFMDDTFTASRRRVLEICEGLSQI